MSKPVELTVTKTITLPYDEAERLGLADYVQDVSTPEQEWISPKEAAAWLSVSVDTIYDLIHDRSVIYRKIGNRNYRILKESLNP